MKISLGLFTICAGLLSASFIAFAVPGMLPKHPGYRMRKAVDPVKGRSLANDPGQVNATGAGSLAEAALFDDAHVKQSLSMNRNDQRLLDKPGSGLLPKVQGSDIKNEPPVKEGTKVNASPHRSVPIQ
jgi:hypothetical protein